ncbi:MAG: glycosyltransferase [Magnetococcales bacterium]|nr:glycosyltransferase [Magnetococcales bacterium]
MKVTHIITGLSTGGAEMMLYKLLANLNRDTIDCEVISLTDIGPIGVKMQKIGIPVRPLKMHRGRPSLRALFCLVRMLQLLPPTVVQTWMYHSDLLGGVAAKMAGDIPVVWGIRHSDLSKEANKTTTIWTAKLCSVLSSKLPTNIICNSKAAVKVHAEFGYNLEKMVVIPNGFDVANFKPDKSARKAVINELNIADDAILIGMVARFDPLKDHKNFIDAAAILKTTIANAHFILCGDGITDNNSQLTQWIAQAKLDGNCHLLGRRDDIAKITASLDIATSASIGEGFSNTIGEAMACSVPVVATDVGDSAYIVGDGGEIVPAKNCQSLAQAWEKLITAGQAKREEFGKHARRRIMSEFDIKTVAKQYETLYQSIANKCVE